MTLSLEQADQIAQALWDEDVESWRTHWVPIFSKFADDLAIIARIHDRQLVLDVGTGTGTAAIAAAKSAPHGFVFGTDRSMPILSVAKSDGAKKGPWNVRFLLMDTRSVQFPDGLFDNVISNCGISFQDFNQTAAELFRVLRPGGSLTYNNWHLKEVPVHRMFGEILQQHRTTRSSAKLRAQRTALATLERYGNWDMNWETQTRELKQEGFSETQVRRKSYEISLVSVDDFLEMRFSRATLRQELRELTAAKWTELYNDLRAGLKQFTKNKRFKFEWKITFIRAMKP
jgi:ubiquinone/menaquinone biosynthesis C-methylase UbiE